MGKNKHKIAEHFIGKVEINALNNKLRILLLAPYLPAIDTSACSRKIYDCIRLLHKRGHAIYLLSFCSDQDRVRINAISPYCAKLDLEYIRDYTCYPSHSVFLKQKISSLCMDQKIDILQCEKAYMNRYVPENIKIASILVEHDVLSVSFWERAKLTNNFINKLILLARKTKKRMEERNWYSKFDKIIVFSEYDKDTIHNLYGIENIEVIPLGINLEDYPLQQTGEKLYDLIFVGNFFHSPNVDAVLYFYEEILPKIKNRLSNVSVMLVGAEPPDSIKKLVELDKNISVTGYVKDISEIYSKSKIFVAPVRYGTGMRYKILEALVLRIPVVTTSVGARGIKFEKNIKIADTAEEFADVVIGLLSNPAHCEDLANNGRLLVEKNYNWDTLLDRYVNIYYDLLKIN